METSIQKWGNSIGVRIPAKIAGQLRLKEGSLVDLKIEADHLTIYPKKYYLEQMLSSINKNNIHEDEFDEDHYGEEAW